jgi:hydroxymethylpyrimidine/phosphomethylpyrimidine kinase
LARGHDVVHAVARAKQFVTQAIRTAPALGHGAGPLNHHAGI